MAIKTLNGNLLFKRAESSAIDSTVLADKEMVLDMQGTRPQVRLGDGVTSGGLVVETEQIAMINPPSVLSPSDGASGVVVAPTLTLSGFSGLRSDLVSDNHVATYWEISEASDFSTHVYQSGRDTTNLTTIDLDGIVELGEGTTQYIRARFEGSDSVLSEWSNTSSFTTETSTVVGNQIDEWLHDEGGAQFGYNVDCSGSDRIIVGAPFDDTPEYSLTNNGGAWIFIKSGNVLQLEQRIWPPAPVTTHDNFGSAVALSGNGEVAAVSARGSNIGNSKQGAVYVFRRTGTTWNYEETLSPTSPHANMYFGHDLSLDYAGNTLLVTTPYANRSTTARGCGFIFEHNGSSWVMEQELISTISLNETYVGDKASISRDGLLAILTSPYYYKSNKGRIFIFSKHTGSWIYRGHVDDAGGSNGERFGESVSISGDGTRVAIGAPNDNAGNGAVSIFDVNQTNGTLTYLGKVYAPVPEYGSSFGRSVALNHDASLLVVSAPQAGVGGKVHLYGNDGSWNHLNTVVDNNSNNWFGYSVAMSDDGSTAVAGAVYHDSQKGKIVLIG